MISNYILLHFSLIFLNHMFVYHLLLHFGDTLEFKLLIIIRCLDCFQIFLLKKLQSLYIHAHIYLFICIPYVIT
jgi:hypothetical protein